MLINGVQINKNVVIFNLQQYTYNIDVNYLKKSSVIEDIFMDIMYSYTVNNGIIDKTDININDYDNNVSNDIKNAIVNIIINLIGDNNV